MSEPFTRSFWSLRSIHLHVLCTSWSEILRNCCADICPSRFVCLWCKTVEARSRKLWDCHCSAPCGMQISLWHAEGGGTDWEASWSRHDLRPTGSAKCPGLGQMVSGPCSTDNWRSWAQLPGQTETGNQLGDEWCNFFFFKQPGWG